MSYSHFSPGFRQFIHRYIRSVEQIDVLILLFEGAERPWAIGEIVAGLRSSEIAIRSRLKALRSAGLVTEAEGGYRYGANGHLDLMVRELRLQYAVRRYSVIELVFSRDPMDSIAEAFRLLKDDDDAGR